MQKFNVLQAIAAPLPMINVDTDLIYPKQFLKTIQRAGLGQYAFHDVRYLPNGTENPDFILNHEPYRKAGILIAGANFGSGSSREHAPWALLDMGIRCIIAPSFADIFYNNCFKNGILPVILPQEQVDQLMKEAQDNPNALTTIDLEKQTVTRGNKYSFSFEVDEFRKNSLLNGLDDIALTLEKEKLISDFEIKDKEKRSWL